MNLGDTNILSIVPPYGALQAGERGCACVCLLAHLTACSFGASLPGVSRCFPGWALAFFSVPGVKEMCSSCSV